MRVVRNLRDKALLEIRFDDSGTFKRVLLIFCVFVCVCVCVAGDFHGKENRQGESHDCLFNSLYAVWIVYFFQPQSNLFELLKNIMATFL